MPESAEGIFALDCAIDGQGAQAIRGLGPSAAASGPALHLERCTLRGDVNARQIDLATETIFDGVVTVERRQTGCVRFSYVTPGSGTPRRYRCQPGLAERAEIARIAISGGAGRHPLIRQILADTTGKPVVAPESAEPVLLGAAMLGALAGGRYEDAGSAMRAMARSGGINRPNPEAVTKHLDRYVVFKQLQAIAATAV